jgi:hypothetical protein
MMTKHAPSVARYAFPKRSFLEDLELNHGPRGLLAQYFINVEQHLLDQGLRVSFAPYSAIAELNAENLATWDMLLPMLDPEQNPVTHGESLAFLVYDRRGVVISSMAARLYDFSGTTLVNQVENLEFYYGPKAGQFRERVQSNITAPQAFKMSGRAAYLGGYWLRPDVRARGLSRLIPRLMRYIALTRWNAVQEFSYGRNQFLRPEVALTYGFDHVEPAFEYYLDKRLIWRGVLLWTSRDEMLQHLPELLSSLKDSSQHSGGRNHEAGRGVA